MDYRLEAENIIKKCRSILTNKKINVSEIVHSQYCYDLDIFDGKDKLKLRVYYSKKGNKIILQGFKGPFYYRISEYLTLNIAHENGDNVTENNLDIKFDSYIGTDESGKGDFFGPLIVGGCYVNKKTSKLLIDIGVKDSKLLNENQITFLSSKIKEIVGTNYQLLCVLPKRYNEIYGNYKNLNYLLAEAHITVINKLFEKTFTKNVIVDKFGKDEYIRNKNSNNLNIKQQVRAEQYVGVAAASILARDRVNKWFIENSSKFDIELPKGAGPAVIEIANKLSSLHGKKILDELTKKHFKTSGQIL